MRRRAEIGLFQNRLAEYRFVEIAMVEDGFGQIGFHEIDGNHAAGNERYATYFQCVEFAEIEHAMGKLHFEDELVAHRKVDVLHEAMLKMDRAESHVVDFRARKSAVLEMAIDECYPDEIAGRKVTPVKNATLELFQVQVFAAVSDSCEFLLENVCAHRCKNTLFPMDIL